VRKRKFFSFGKTLFSSVESGWKSGAKRLLGKTSSLLKRLSSLLLKFVKTAFPWNRRARRRLQGEQDDEL